MEESRHVTTHSKADTPPPGGQNFTHLVKSDRFKISQSQQKRTTEWPILK